MSIRFALISAGAVLVCCAPSAATTGDLKEKAVATAEQRAPAWRYYSSVVNSHNGYRFRFVLGVRTPTPIETELGDPGEVGLSIDEVPAPFTLRITNLTPSRTVSVRSDVYVTADYAAPARLLRKPGIVDPTTPKAYFFVGLTVVAQLRPGQTVNGYITASGPLLNVREHQVKEWRQLVFSRSPVRMRLSSKTPAPDSISRQAGRLECARSHPVDFFCN